MSRKNACDLPPALRRVATLAAALLSAAGLRTQGEAAGPVDPVEQRLLTKLAEWEGEITAARDALRQVLVDAIAKEADEAMRKRRELDLLAFDGDGLLPATALAAARKFEQKRKEVVSRMDLRLRADVEQLAKKSAVEAANRCAEKLDLVQARLDESRYRDLRCTDRFAEAVTKSGFAWDGAELVSPKDAAASLRIPSELEEQLHDRYQCVFEIERVEGDGPLRILLPVPGCTEPYELATLVLDAKGGRCGLESVGGQRFDGKASGQGQWLRPGDPTVIEVCCKTNGITVRVDGNEVLDFDRMKQLRSSADVDKLSLARRSLHVVTSPGTRFRLNRAGFRAMADASPAATAPWRQRVAAVADELPVGRSWSGKTDGGAVTNAKVVARNQALRTATLVLKAGNGWHVRLAVKTNASGGQFEIVNATRLDAPVLLNRESGNGSASASGIHIVWRWANHRGGNDGIYEGWFKGTR